MAAPAGTALQFNGTNQSASVGTATTLRASAFTLELWFKRAAGGVTVGTGNGGVTAFPLITKGRAEAETQAADVNYFLGINTAGRLVADFEEAQTGASPSANHPITGTGVVLATDTGWHHAAATYDGTTWRLYLDGLPDGSVAVGQPANALNNVITAIGTTLNAGTAPTGPVGFFSGTIDEVRIWNVARSQAQIQAAKDTEITAPAANLIGAWNLNDGSGSNLGDSSGNLVTGTTVGNPAWVAGFEDPGNTALQFNGTNQSASVGTATTLRASAFTLELWFKRAAGGVTVGTGNGGVTAFPLITKGRAEAETQAADVNYFLGINTAGRLVADFEEAQTGASPSANHPITGTGVVLATDTGWHHAAATYDGTTWRLYLDGLPDGSVAVGQPANALNNVITAIGTTLNAGTAPTGPVGFFSGTIDEVRIWNVARSQAQIQAAKDTEITAPAANLIGAWNLNDGSGSNLGDSSGNLVTGTTVGNPAWVAGFDPPPPPSQPPDAPVLSAPANGATGVATPPTLDVVASDPNADPLSVQFFGRPLASGNFASIGTDSDVASGDHATIAWPGLGGGQTYEWFATVSDGTTTTTGPTWTFHTAAGTGTPFTGAGDIATCANDAGTNDDARTAAILAGIDGAIFTTGDNVYPNGTASEFTNCYDPVWGPPFKARTRPVPGNHDWNTANLAGYKGYFGDNATDANGQSYYSYDLDTNWHVVNLDSECDKVPGGCGVGSPQEVWLKADLAAPANAGKNVIAIWHKPRFSSGITNLTDVQPLVDALYAAGVDIALVGHDHIYERFQPLDPSGTHDPAFGIRHFTIGTGGEAHHGAGTPLPTSEALDDNTFGIMKFTLRPADYDWVFLPIAGSTFTDSGTGTVHGAPPGPGENGLQLGTSGAYVTFGDPAKLDLAQFTIETWFNRTDDGVANTTGTAGIPSFIPLVTHGGPQGEGSDIDANWLLGIDDATDVLAIDSEEGPGGPGPLGQNHPVRGTTAITMDAWHHAAATYDGTTWRIYLDGQLEATQATPAPRSDTSQHAALGAMLNSSGTPGNTARFHGILDEARAWNGARSLAQIRATINLELTTGFGLVARWGMSESFGTAVADSITAPAAANGTIVGSGASRVENAPFNIVFDTTPPAPPTGLIATPGDATVNLAWAANGEPDLAGYRVYRATAPGVPTTGTPLNGAALLTSPAFADDTAVNGTPYYYVVVAVDSSGNPSTASNEATATPTGDAAPAAPTGLAAAPGDDTVSLTWNPNDEADLAGYNIYRGLTTPNPTTDTPLNGSTLLTTASYTDPTAANGGTYHYVVTAVDLTDLESAASAEAVATPFEPTPHALDFDGTDDHVTFGPAVGLGLTTLTIEGWVRRDGIGTGTSTGSGGLGDAVPLITKGRSQDDEPANNVNWFLGIDEATGVLVADFEDDSGGNAHPIIGSSPIEVGRWYHVAATYDGTTWRLYVNGGLDASEVESATPEDASTQHAALATAMDTNGAPSGRFNGVLDEVRIWNVARSQALIQAAMGNELEPQGGLVARWAMNEGSGTTVINSVPGGPAGETFGSPAWVAGTPFVSDANRPPSQPTSPSPADGATGVSTLPTLSVNVSDPDGDPLTTSFFGRPAPTTPGEDFTIVVIPDTQHYTDDAGRAATFTQQTQWIVDNTDDLNIAFVSHLGDITENFDTLEVEWQRADASMDVLDLAGVRNNLAPGNHDMGTGETFAFYDEYFPPSRYDLPSNPWYGGWLGEEPGQTQRLNKDNYELFTAGGIDFLVIHLEIDMPSYAIAWANEIVDRYPTRTVIVSTHAFLNTSNNRPTGTITGRANGRSAAQVWTDLIAPNCNIRFVVNGHYPGEGRATTNNSCGQPVHQLLTDYQSRSNGGDGWLRYYTFKPSENKVYAFTYSSKLGTFENDATSQFILDHQMGGSGAFTLIGATTTPSGSTASVSWPGRAQGSAYEWYATVSDGPLTTIGPTSSFTTASNGPPTFNQDLPNRTDAEGAVISLSAAATDPDGDTLVYGATNLPPGLTINSSTGLISGTIAFSAAPGPYAVSVTVRDTPGLPDDATDTFSWTVTDVTPPAGITFRSAAYGSNNAITTSLTLARPAPLVAGDLLLAAVTIRGTSTITPPAGWTLVRDDVNASNLRQATYWKSATGSEPATWTWTFSGPRLAAGGIHAYSGVHATTPIDIHGGQANPSGTSLTAPGVTTTVASTRLVAFFSMTTNATITPPPGMTERGEQIGTDPTRLTVIEGSDALQAATGPTGTRVATASLAGLSIGQLIALRPAAGGPPPNGPPTFNQDLPNRTDAEGAVISLSAAATDPDGDTLVYGATNLPPGLTINTSTGLISGTIGATAAPGPYAVSITVRDTPGLPDDATDTFSWTVTEPGPNGPPTFNQDLPNRTDAEGAVISLSAAATDPDGDTLVYGATNLPPGLTINSSTGLISGTIAFSAAPGPYAVSVTVRDTPGLPDDATDTFSWTVTDVTPPAGITFRSAAYGSNNAITTSLTLARPAPLVAGDLLLAAVTIRGTSTITPPAGWTLVRDDVNASNLRQATYWKSATGSEPATWTWTFSGPRLAAGGIHAYSGVHATTPIDIHGGQANPSGTSLTAPGVTTTVASTRLVAFFSMTTNATITPPPGMTERGEQIGTDPTRLTVIEGSDALQAATGPTGTRVATASLAGLSIGQLIALRPAAGGPPPNGPPTFNQDLPNRTDAEGAVISLSAAATDPDGDTLVYGATNLPPGLTINTSTGLISGTIGATAAPGPYAVSITVRDTPGLPDDATDTFSWTVTEPGPNGPPTFNQDLPNRTDAEGAVISLSAAATDPDGDTLVYGATNLPPGLTINSSTGLISGTIAFSAAPGPYAVSVTVRDTPGLPDDATDTFSWTVTDVTPPAGITFRSAAYGSNNAITTSLTLARPAPLVAGDLLLAAVTIRGTSTITPPAGWTLVRDDVNASNLRQATYWKSATGSEPATWTWTFSGPRLAAGGIHAYSGVHATTPIDIHGGQANPSGTSLTAPGVTTTVASTRLVAFFSMTTNATITPPPGMTERGEQIGTDPTRLTVIEGSDALQAATGPTGTRVATASLAGLSIGQLIALRPAP